MSTIPANEKLPEHPSAAPSQKPIEHFSPVSDALNEGKKQAVSAVKYAQSGEEGLYHDFMDGGKDKKTDWKAVGGHAMQVAPMGAAAIIGFPMLAEKWGSILESNKGKSPSQKVGFFGRIGRLFSALLWTGGVCVGAVALTNLMKDWREKKQEEQKKKLPKTMPAKKPISSPAS